MPRGGARGRGGGPAPPAPPNPPNAPPQPPNAPVPPNPPPNNNIVIGIDDDIDPPAHPDEQYAPLGTDAKYRKQRIIDLAGQDPCKAGSCLARMRVYREVPGQPANRPRNRIAYTRNLEPAPLDWFEFYSNLRVESWVYMWVHAFNDGPRGQLIRAGPRPLRFQHEYQYHIPGPYTIRSREWDDDPYRHQQQTPKRFMTPATGPGKQVKAAFVDFIWLPPPGDVAGVSPIVMMEVDENNHYSAGWDSERYREVFILQELHTRFPKNKNILIIRFNPHEYKNKAKGDVDAGDADVFTTGVSR